MERILVHGDHAGQVALIHAVDLQADGNPGADCLGAARIRFLCTVSGDA